MKTLPPTAVNYFDLHKSLTGELDQNSNLKLLINHNSLSILLKVIS